MWKPLVDLLVGVFLAFWKEWQARKDVQTIERQKFALEAAERAAVALAFKARADATAARLRDAGGRLGVSRPDPPPGRPPD
jgi:hypothetical protein